MLEGLGTALNSEPTAADDRDADPSARGETAAESFNDAYDDIGPAERAQSQVNEAFLGLEPEQDLGRLIEGAGKTAAGLVRNETQLQELVSNFNTTMAALASEDDEPARVDPRARADARERQRARSRRSTRRSRRRARSRARSCPACARRRRRSTPRSRGSSRRAG